jgi:hypothetical protein
MIVRVHSIDGFNESELTRRVEMQAVVSCCLFCVCSSSVSLEQMVSLVC